MKTTHQNYQITSTLSTRQSHFEPFVITSTPQISGVKKFMRKRDRSTESLRRSISGQTATPRKVVNGERQSIQKTNDQGSESTKLIPQNIDRNFPESTIQKKSIKKLQIDANLNDKQLKRDLNKSGSFTPKDKFQTPLRSTEKKRVNGNRNFQGICLSPKNSCKDKNSNFPIITYNLTNYTEPKTERNIGKTAVKQKPNSMAEISILESQIMILEDQNRRLKKQVVLLQGQKNRQKKLQVSLKQQNVRILNKIEQMKQKSIQNMKYLQKQVSSVYFSLLKNYKFLHQQKDSEANLNCIYQLNPNSVKNDYFQNTDIFQTKFLQQYFPLIHEGLQKCGEEFLRTKVCLQKVLIKQNVLLRGQYWGIRIKSESKNLISRIKHQKSKVQKLKKQCEQLSKQNDRIQKCISIKNKKQIVSERIIGRGDSEGYVSLSFSDSSDQE